MKKIKSFHSGQKNVGNDLSKNMSDKSEQKKSDRTETTELSGSYLSDSYFAGATCSSTECTGLMPAPPATNAELEAYEELYPFRPVSEKSTDRISVSQSQK